jgi:repressor LexA
MGPPVRTSRPGLSQSPSSGESAYAWGCSDVPEKEAAPGNPSVKAGLSEQSDPGDVLTWRQRQILQVIREWGAARGYAPTMREIAEAVGLTSKSSVAHQLSALQKKGYLRRDAGRPRTVEMRVPGHSVVPSESELDREYGPEYLSSHEAVCIPLVGRIAAGEPINAQEANEGAFVLPRKLVGDGDLLVLKVSGDSMINAGIFDADWVVVRRQSVAESGDIVAALINGQEAEATVKTYIRTGSHVWLMPHNPAYTPISGDDAEIVGKVVTLLRRM